MELGIFAKTFQGATILELLKSITQIGFSKIQFNFSSLGLASMPQEVPSEKIAEIQEALKATALSIAAISGTFNMIHPNKKERTLGLDRLKVMTLNCQELDTSVITICTGSRDPFDKWRFHPGNNTQQAWSDLCQTLEKALSIAAEFGVTLAFEPEVANVVNSIGKAKKLLKEMNSPLLKVVFDAANLFEKASLKEIKYLVSKGIAVLGEDIVIVHAKGKDAEGDFVAAGKGIIPFGHLFAELKQIHFEGPLITHGLKESEAQAVYEYLSAFDIQ